MEILQSRICMILEFWHPQDPVALDQACVDLVYASQDDTESLIDRMESRNAVHVLEHGEDIGLGSRTYQMVSIDE